MQRWWRSVLRDFDLSDHNLRQLEAACTAWDRMVQAREALQQHGLTFTDAQGIPRARPEVAIERDSRTGFLRALRELDIDAEALAEPRTRPPALRSNRRGL